MVGPGLGWAPSQEGRAQGAPVTAVAAEELVAPLPGQHHLQRVPRRLGQAEGGQGGVVGGRVIQGPCHLGQEPPELGLVKAHLAPVQVEGPGDLLGLRALVGRAGGVEAAGEGGDRALGQPRHQDGDGGAVDPARQEEAVGRVRPLVYPDAVLQEGIETGHQVGLDTTAVRPPRRQGRAGLMADQALGRDLQDLAGRHAPQGGEDGGLAGGVGQAQEILGCRGVHHRIHQASLQEGARLRGEQHRPVALQEVEGLDAEGVADQPGAPVAPHQAEGVHAAQPQEGVGPFPRIEVQQGLEVGAGGQAPLQAVVPGELQVVVDLAIADHHRARGVQGLPAPLEVDDRQPGVGEGDPRQGLGADAVRAPVQQGGDEVGGGDLAVDHAGYAAHQPAPWAAKSSRQRSTTAARENSPATRARPASARAWRPVASSRRSRIAPARATGSSTATSRPSSPSRIRAAGPVEAAATTGRPWAQAWMTTLPRGS